MHCNALWSLVLSITLTYILYFTTHTCAVVQSIPYFTRDSGILCLTRSHSGAKRELIKEVWRKTLYCVNRTLVFGIFNRSHSGVECELITELGWPRRGLWHSLKKAETDASKRRPHNPARGFQRLLGRSVCIDSSRTLKQTHTDTQMCVCIDSSRMLNRHTQQ